MDVDETLLRLGKFNKRRIATYCMICCSVTITGCWHMMASVFIGGEPDHHCMVPSGQTLNATIPMEYKDKKWRYVQCKRYVNSTVGNETTSCDSGWDYDKSEFTSTIVSDWDLVCDKNYLAETSQSVFNFGVMVGAIIFTSLSHRLGRKPIHLSCQYCMLLLGVAIAFAPNYIVYVVLRFFLGAVREGAGLVGIVMACELYPAVYRTFAGTVIELFWAAAWMFLALMAYLIRDWRHLQLAITLPGILTLPLIWDKLMPESVPWLIANHKLEKAESIVRRVFKTYHARLPASLTVRRQTVHTLKVADIQAVAERATLRGRIRHSISQAIEPSAVPADIRTHVTVCDLLRSRKMVLYTAVMCSLWLASGIVYFGLSLSTSTLAGNKYINFFLSGAVEAPAYGLTVVVLQKFGRRWPLFVFHIVTGVALFVNIFIPEETEDGRDLTPLIVTLSMTGKFAMTAAFGTVVLFAQEIYPTNVRNFGFGIASCSARIGGMIAPFLAYIGKFASWIPGIVFATLAIVTGIFALVLPETLNRPLPETVKEVESWTRSLQYNPPHPPAAEPTARRPHLSPLDEDDEKDSTKL